MSAPPSSVAVQLPRPGDLVGGKFVLDALLGQGGMGAVYRARHRTLGHEVAIKVMFADASNPEAAARFQNEGSAAARIKSDHVMKVHDVDRELDYLYMVCELLEGEDLSQVLDREKRVPFSAAVTYVLEALDGIGQAHAMGIVHRDLKPSNLFVANESGGGKTVKVLDFGISKASSTSPLNQSPSSLTSTKAMLGSPLYMSPEQLRSSKSVDARADIWATGVILFELITGSLPFTGESLGELFAAILESDPPVPSSRMPGLPPGLDAVILRCLQRRPENRYQSARELSAALAPFAQPGAFGMATQRTSAPDFAGAGSTLGMSTPDPSFGPPRPPPPGAVTPGGGGPRPMAMGTPNPHAGAQTNSSWQTSYDLPKRPNTALLIGLGAAAVLMSGIGISLIALSRHGKDADPGSANPPPSASVVEVVSSAPPAATEVPPAEPAATTTAAAVAVEPTTTVADATKPAAPQPKPKPAATTTHASKTPTPPKPNPTATGTSPGASKPAGGAGVLSR